MNKLIVIKIGGNIIDEEQKLLLFLKSFAAIKEKKILIHGGGKLATKLAGELGVPQKIVEGRRYTDSETLKIVTMVYAGYINKNIIAQLQANQCNAIGLTGVDGNIITAHKRNSNNSFKNGGPDYGFVGDIDTVNTNVLEMLLERGLTVVMAPITHNLNGQLLNTNADTIAREVAIALNALYNVHVIYTFEKAGVLKDLNDENSLLKTISFAEYKKLREEKIIFAGMIPKLDNAFKALEAGVKKVIIGNAGNLDNLVKGNAGTNIVYE